MSTESTYPRIISIASLKGGGGKSDLAANLATVYKRGGASVALIDADKVMNTSVQWSDDRESYIEAHPGTDVEPIYTVKKTGKIGQTAQATAETYDVVIIDTGGQDSSEMRYSLLVADVVITPVEPTQEALDGVEPFMKIVEEASFMNEALVPVAVLTRVPPNSPKRVADARDYLSDYEGLTVADTYITGRVVHPDSKALGLSVVESRDEVAKSEMQNLVIELSNIKKGN